jgi:shikimate kinase
VNANFHGADIDFEQFRDFLVSQFLISGEHQQFPFLSRQRQQCLTQSCFLLLPFEFLVREGASVDNIEIVLQQRFGTMFSEEIRSRVAGNVVHPGAESAVVTKALSIFENSEEHVLNEILRNGAVARQSAEESEKRLVMPIKEETELSQVTVPYCEHQSFVCVLHSVDPCVMTGAGEKGYIFWLQWRSMKYSRIYLIGFMGSGKTTVGRQLARKLGWKFIDLDKEIEQGEKRQVAEIFREKGEAHFRFLEKRYLKEASYSNRAVIALGGGTYIDAQNRALADMTGLTVWLKVSFARVGDRVKMDGTRPKFDNRDEAERLYQDREPHYALARVHVSTDEGTPESVADEIVGVIKKS